MNVVAFVCFKTCFDHRNFSDLKKQASDALQTSNLGIVPKGAINMTNYELVTWNPPIIKLFVGVAVL